ncbi:multisubstrate pseudouridine synthase 7 [Coemansia sp. RSA 1722]|nr:multisubstrate pseudouridine synthase 7 [Coemansia sp. RSA 485]KAJ2599681.1 multisubstrate pseudouridine synthase 7 [Coemansia sp. RSA 1722]
MPQSEINKQQPETKGTKADNQPPMEELQTPETKRTKTEETPAKEEMQKPDFLRERDVGITEYITEGWHGFDAIIKHRFSDFLVNEIDPQGNVVHLTSYTEADDPEPEPTEEEKAIKAMGVPEDPQEAFTKAFEHLEPILGIADTEAIKAHLENNSNDDLSLEQRTLELDRSLDKQQRKEVYRVTNNFLGTFVTVETVDGKLRFIRRIRAEGTQQQQKKNVQRPRGWGAQWRHAGDHCYFVLQKENSDTMDVLGQIARKLRVKPRAFGTAGTKDKRGITVQRCSAHRIDHKRLIGIGRQLRGVQLGNFSYGAEELRLGQLAGNRFCIVLRYVQGADENGLEPVLEALRNTGFINYYGMQRFGTQSISSHTVGIAVLKADWPLVIDLIMRPRPGDNNEAARALYMQGDFAGALRAMPGRSAVAERAVLQAFVNAGDSTNAMAAFGAIPRNLRLMYVHAYQSFVWNAATSLRISLFGVSGAVPGDLVIKAKGLSLAGADAEADADADNGTQVASDTEPTLVTVANAHEYTIYDVVLPLPGWAVRYPEHQVQNVYKELMDNDGLSPASMDKHPMKEYRLAGAYRHVVVRPRDFTHQWMRFTDDTVALTQSDSDKIDGKPLPVSVPEGIHVALKLAFDLPSSSYATMLLRELMRKETAAGHQSTLSSSNKAN